MDADANHSMEPEPTDEEIMATYRSRIKDGVWRCTNMIETGIDEWEECGEEIGSGSQLCHYCQENVTAAML